MKKIYLAFAFVLVVFTAGAQAPFVTTWLVDSNDLEITIPTLGDGYNYTVDFGDGTVMNNVTGDISHTYSTPDDYTVEITGDFPRIYFNNNSQLANKLLMLFNWGDIEWQSMEKAFAGCSNLSVMAPDNPDLSAVTNMSYMFEQVASIQYIYDWDVSNVTNMQGLFYNVDNCSSTLGNWDVSNVTNMSYMFYHANGFNQPLNNWDVSNVTNMSNMFNQTNGFNQPLNSWDVSNVTSMSSMFYYANMFNQPLNNWDVSNVSDMSYMFYNAVNFNQPIDSWDVSGAINMRSMFANATNYGSFNQTLNTWDVSSVLDMRNMFTNSIFNQPLDNWDVSSVTNMSGMFGGPLTGIFNKPIENWDVSSVTDMSRMFFMSQYNQPLNTWDVSNITDMSEMFAFTHAFNHPLNNWDVSSVITMSRMFYNNELFNQPLGDWNVSNVEDMNYMFYDNEFFNQNLEDWDVSNVTDMSNMFSETFSFNQPLNNWDVSSVVDMGNMFREASAFNQPLNSWDVSSVVDMGNMFREASAFNQPLNSWDVSGTGQIRGVFYNASSFNQDLSTWEINTSDLEDFLSGSGMDINNYDAFLSRLENLDSNNGTLDADGLEYCNLESHDFLINNLGWTINGDSQSSNCNFITGAILYDETNNGCDANDIGITGFMVNANDGTNDLTTFSSDGTYTLGTLGTSFTVSLLNIPDYFTSDPVSANVVFTGSNTEVVDFCVTANQSIEDLNITLLPITQARPGFEAEYQLVVENRGTQDVANVNISLVFDEAKQTFVEATPAPTTTTNNELTFEVPNLPPFGQQVFDVTMETFAPPIVEGGDILNFTANVTPNTNDNTPEDNTFIYEQIVVNSFDPNDKQVLQGEEIYLEEADEYLYYIIRFQNTGTASAINVRILDTLHLKLDWTTLLPINASHDYHVEITEGNRVEFIFDNINLPHTEPESHGFVAYKIKPENDVQVGDVITGDAGIYFDFNPPIITNTVSTTVIDNLSVGENNQISVSIYPVPSTDVLNIRSATAITEVRVYNELGQVLLTLKETEGIEQINIEKLSRGIYFVKLMDADDNTVVRKFIKG